MIRAKLRIKYGVQNKAINGNNKRKRVRYSARMRKYAQEIKTCLQCEKPTCEKGWCEKVGRL